MEKIRLKKVTRLLEKELSEIFRNNGPRIINSKLISVTRIRVSSDLSLAKVFLSIFPSNNTQEVMNDIAHHNRYFRNLLAKKVRYQLRIIPELLFFLDDSADYVDEIDRLLKK